MLIDRLRRVTRDGRWIPEVDGLRFVAISAVLLVHVFEELSFRSGRTILVESNFWWLERLFDNGVRGVGLFFAISGMILALPFARQFLLKSKIVSLRKYYLRRVTRLEPPYVASVVIALIMVAVYHHGLTAGFGLHVLTTMFYQHNLVFGEMSTLNGVTWSLEVEIQFYILAPLVMQVYRVRSTVLRRSLLLASVLGIGLAQIPFQTWPRFKLSILFYLQYFLVGLLVADVFVMDLDNMRFSWGWDIAGIASLFAIFWSREVASWSHTLLPFAIAVLCVSVMRSHGLRRVLANRWVAVTGGMCYSIYLLHFLFIAALFKVTRRAILPGSIFVVNYTIQLLLTAVPVVALCALFFLLVERPCMSPDWPAKLWHKFTGHWVSKLDASESSPNA